MSYANASTLKAFSDATWLTGVTPPDGLAEAILQADDIIYQKTGIKAPSDPATARPILRNVACALIIWFTTGQQNKLSEEELKRREKQYDDAMRTLDDIASGKLNLIDDEGTLISEPARTSSSMSSTKRITGAL